jgi:hypothetical protein
MMSDAVKAFQQMSTAGYDQSSTFAAIQDVYGVTPDALICAAVSSSPYTTAQVYYQMETFATVGSNRSAATAVLKGCGLTAATCAAGLLDAYLTITDRQLVQILFKVSF